MNAPGGAYRPTVPVDDPSAGSIPTASRWTEAELLRRLAARYEKEDRGNGPAYVFARHVKNAAGFGASRALDGVAVSLWPSKGCAVHGFEIKVSRGDWLRELADPTKAGAFLQHLDFMWLVAPLNVVKDDLPDGWGWMAPIGDGLRVQRQAVALRPVQPWYAGPCPAPAMDRGFVAALLRSARHRPVDRGDEGPAS